ncbi:oligosaccharide repeat unit polymerase [Tropicimonas sediminicola]|uniref:O-Antigen ligase n=1 Tax=Tropicimonas sediminicola TaxID=1031541 RepID=A0A239M4D7_9RHOB|nr:oligosaccharide repeat unit polymerase [Tropicimonas sediminicola]SNT36819.1 hypothetical protein SAMN05421757_11242 [Tropicimonas sediminicola]
MSKVLGDRPAVYRARDAHRREAQRRGVVWATLLLFLLLLVEGPLRKWFLPGLAGPLTLLRDPFALLLYAHCINKGFIWTRGMAQIWLLFALVSAPFALQQYALNGYGIPGWLLGLRTYWMYMPIAFVIAATHRRDDILRFLRVVLAIAIPYAFLVARQYGAPPFAFVNWGVAGDIQGAVALGDGIVRPFGLFTYTAPNVLYTAFTLAAFLAYYLTGPKGWKQQAFLVAAGFAVATMSVLTGSRTIYFQVAAITGFTLIGLLATRPTVRTVRRIAAVLVFIGLVALIFVKVFPDMLVAMGERFESASRSEGGLWNRIYYNAFSFLDALDDAGLLGFGMGAGTPGVANYLRLPNLFLGESDTQRNVNELGLILGPLFLLLRFTTAFWLGAMAVGLARRRDHSALPIAGFAMTSFAFGAVTNSTIEALLVWTAVGLVIAARKSLDLERLHQQPTEPRQAMQHNL